MRDDKPYFKLRQQMFAFGIKAPELAECIGRKERYVQERLSGRDSFTVEEAYSIMEYLEIDPIRMTEFFPRSGKTMYNIRDYVDDIKAAVIRDIKKEIRL